MFMYEEIGRRIRNQRKFRRMTQQQLSELSDISPSFLGHIERGTRKLSVETLYRISVALDCSIDELMPNGKRSEINLHNLLLRAAEYIGSTQKDASR